MAPKADPDREVTYYTRSKAQDEALGMYEQNDQVIMTQSLIIRVKFLIRALASIR